jgi:hypothetical protein
MKYLSFFEKFLEFYQPKPRNIRDFWNENLHQGILKSCKGVLVWTDSYVPLFSTTRNMTTQLIFMTSHFVDIFCRLVL